MHLFAPAVGLNIYLLSLHCPAISIIFNISEIIQSVLTFPLNFYLVQFNVSVNISSHFRPFPPFSEEFHLIAGALSEGA